MIGERSQELTNGKREAGTQKRCEPADRPSAFALTNLREHDTWVLRELRLEQVRVGMIFDDGVLSKTGVLVVPPKTEVTIVILERLERFASGVGIEEPIRVRMAG